MVCRPLIQPARADRDVRALADRGQQPLGLFHRRREVGVGEHHDLAGGVQHSVADAIALAPVHRVFYQAHHRIARGESADDFGSLVPGAVVDDNHLGRPAPFMDTGQTPARARAPIRALSLYAGMMMLNVGPEFISTCLCSLGVYVWELLR